jgi:hypothetical protein
LYLTNSAVDVIHFDESVPLDRNRSARGINCIIREAYSLVPHRL